LYGLHGACTGHGIQAAESFVPVSVVPDTVLPVEPVRVHGEGPCPHCGSYMAPDAVVCIDCGFNRKTGKLLRTISKRFERHWDSSDFPYWVRLVLFGVLVGLLCLPVVFSEDLAMAVLLLGVGSVLGALLLGTLKRITLTRDREGRVLVLRRWWVGFLPTARSTVDLTDYGVIRLGHKQGTFGWDILLFLLLLCLIGLLPGLLLWWWLWMRRGQFTLEIAGTPNIRRDTEVDPLLLYRGASEVQMRAIAETLKEVGGLRYG
jgi:hypothetical protein